MATVTETPEEALARIQAAGFGKNDAMAIMAFADRGIDFVAIHPFSLVPGSPLATRPELAGIHKLPRQGVLTPNLPYDHTNPVAMRPQDLPQVAETIQDVLSDSFPQSGRLWTCGIGGWLTFAASCNNQPEFFKRKLPV